MPIATVLTLDYSSSMSENDIAHMKEAAKTFLGNLDPQDRTQLLVLAAKVFPVPTDGLSTDIALLLQAIEIGFPEGESRGSTSLYDAVGAGLQILAEERVDGLPLVVAFSDGQDNNSAFDEADCLDLSAEYDVPIFSVGFGSADEAALKRLVSSGSHEHAPDSRTLSDIYAQMSRKLRRTYVLSWETSHRTGDTVWVEVTVAALSALTSLGCSARATEMGERISHAASIPGGWVLVRRHVSIRCRRFRREGVRSSSTAPIASSTERRIPR